jgi:hypothetical protein
MASYVLFTGDIFKFVYHGQWIALSSVHVVALALVYHGQWIAQSSTGDSFRLAYHGQ